MSGGDGEGSRQGYSSPGSRRRLPRETKETYCFDIPLLLSTQGGYTEVSYRRLVLEQDMGGRGVVERNEEEQASVPITKKKKRLDFGQPGLGYDDEDSFIDNSEECDEQVPAEVDTTLGGFYINTGHLELRPQDEEEEEELVRGVSVTKAEPGRKAFVCRQCPARSYLHRRSLENHMVKKHGVAKVAATPGASSLEIHKVKKHGVAAAPGASSPENHKAQEHGVARVTAAPGATSLENHMAKEHGVARVVAAPGAFSLENHMAKEHGVARVAAAPGSTRIGPRLQPARRISKVKDAGEGWIVDRDTDTPSRTDTLGSLGLLFLFA